MQSTELVEKLFTHYSVTYREASKGQDLTPEMKLQKLKFLSSVPEGQKVDYEAFKKFLVPNEYDLELAFKNSMIRFKFDDTKDRHKAIEQFL